MRFLFKISMPAEAGNSMAKKDAFATIAKSLEEQKPEAVYFGAWDGKRTGFLIVNLNDASQIPEIAGPWFLSLNSGIEVVPVMVPEDLGKATPAIERAVKSYGG